jgi:hypothetical protein
MKKALLLTFSLLFINIIFAQKRAIKITSPDSKRTILIKENKRIRLVTKNKEKISGRFKIENNSILINNQLIPLSDIEGIKRNPLLTTALTSGFFIFTGATTVGFGTIIGAFLNTRGFLLAIPGAAMIFTGIKSPNFNKMYKKQKNWSLEIININP